MVFMKYHANIPAAFVILKKWNSILLMRRYDTGYADGMYSLPAWHVEKDENFSDCIIREAREETWIILLREDVQLVHMRHQKSNNSVDNWCDRINAFFVATNWEGEIQNMEQHKCDEMSWFDVGNLPENTIPYIWEILMHISNWEFYSEFGW